MGFSKLLVSLPTQLIEIDAKNVTKMHFNDNNGIPYSCNLLNFSKYS